MCIRDRSSGRAGQDTVDDNADLVTVHREEAAVHGHGHSGRVDALHDNLALAEDGEQGRCLLYTSRCV